MAVDSRENVAAIAEAARGAGVTIRLVIEVDMGMKRAGVAPGEACVELARFIAAQSGVTFAGADGLGGADRGHCGCERESRGGRRGRGGHRRRAPNSAARPDCRSGSSVAAAPGTYWITTRQPGITEIQAGGGVFCDVHYRKDFGVEHPYALTIMTTVISRPTPNRIICDAGKKTMSSDAAMPEPLGLGAVRAARLSAEHGTIELESRSDTPRVGDRLEWIVGYSDTTVHLHEEIYATRQGRIEAVWPIAGRGKIR